MSNRGYRRDNRPNYQSQQSSQYGGRSMNVNPWEGGMVPGSHQQSLAGLLPTPQNSNLLEQLSLPQAQLAIASNLLTTLLRPQQSQVPSLLSLNPMNQLGRNPVAFGQQANFNQNFNRYNNNLGSNRRQLKPRMDSRPLEPYKRMPNRNRVPEFGQNRRNPSSQGGAAKKSAGYNPNVVKHHTNTDSKSGKMDSKESKPSAETKFDKSEEAGKNSDQEELKREHIKDDDKKVDKEDAKIDDDLGSSSENSKIVLEKNKNESEVKGKGLSLKSKKDDAEIKTSVDKKGEGRHSRYHGVYTELMFCHVCKKHMWDDLSFENHLKGRSHQLMMDKLEESYRIKVELMRHELKVTEEQREIEMDRMRRQGKKVPNLIHEYCTMCDLHFFGTLIVHRKSEPHQKLKKFLHPKCTNCNKEFSTRLEWDIHKLTPNHLKKTTEVFKKHKMSDDANIDEEFKMEDFLLLESFGDDGDKSDIQVKSGRDEVSDINTSMECEEKAATTEGDGVQLKDGNGTRVNTSFANLKAQLPKYNPDVSVGKGLLKSVTGKMCRVCNKFFVTDDEADTHCRTLTHYNAYIALLKTKIRITDAKTKARTSESVEEETYEELKATKRGNSNLRSGDDEGNWKRCKLTSVHDEHEADMAANEEDTKMEDSSTPVESKVESEEFDSKADVSLTEEADASTPTLKAKDQPGLLSDDNLWEEVDRDLGSMLEDVMGDPLDPEENTQNGKDVKDSGGRGRRKNLRSNTTSPAASRGKKKK